MKKILIIEDDSSLRENLTLLLSIQNYATVVAETGEKGIELIQSTKPDLIICDIMLPDIDGYEVLSRISKISELKLIPFIFLTAKAEMADLRIGMNLGADDYLTKPFKKEELLKVIETRLSKYESVVAKPEDDEDEFQMEDRVLFGANEKVQSVAVKDIECILADGVYSKVHLNDGKSYLIRKSMVKWEKVLPDKYFIRIHRSSIVNLQHISRIERGKNQNLRIYLNKYLEGLEVGKSYNSNIKKKIVH